MGTKSREYGSSVRAAADRRGLPGRRLTGSAHAAAAGAAQPSPTIGDALNAGYSFLEVRCLGCNTHQTVALDIIRRPKTTPIHELERYMRCKDCSDSIDP